MNPAPIVDILSAEEAKSVTAFLPSVKKWWWTKSHAKKFKNGLVYAVCDNRGNLIAAEPQKELGVRIAIRNVMAPRGTSFVVGGYEFISLGSITGETNGYLAVSKRIVCVKPFDANNEFKWENSELLKNCVASFGAIYKRQLEELIGEDYNM